MLKRELIKLFGCDLKKSKATDKSIFDPTANVKKVLSEVK